MGGFFGVASKKTVYWSYFTAWTVILTFGTRRGGMAAYGNGEFCRANP